MKICEIGKIGQICISETAPDSIPFLNFLLFSLTLPRFAGLYAVFDIKQINPYDLLLYF